MCNLGNFLQLNRLLLLLLLLLFFFFFFFCPSARYETAANLAGSDIDIFSKLFRSLKQLLC
jgi:hypothetical protein